MSRLLKVLVLLNGNRLLDIDTQGLAEVDGLIRPAIHDMSRSQPNNIITILNGRRAHMKDEVRSNPNRKK